MRLLQLVCGVLLFNSKFMRASSPSPADPLALKLLAGLAYLALCGGPVMRLPTPPASSFSLEATTGIPTVVLETPGEACGDGGDGDKMFNENEDEAECGKDDGWHALLSR